MNEGCYFRVGNYNGSNKKEGWEYTRLFVFDGQTVFSVDGNLSYKEITGLDVPEYPTASDPKREEKIKIYNDYQDNVESYDSFFRLNVPYIQAKISYSVKAENVEKPSCYSIIIRKIEFINIQTGKTIKLEKQYNNDNVSYAYVPETSVDWRLKPARQKAESKKERKISNKYKKEALKSFIDESIGDESIAGFGINIGSWGEIGYSTIYLDIPLKEWVFLDGEFIISYGQSPFDVDFKFPNRTYYGSSSGTIGLMGGPGVNMCLHILDYQPLIYYIFDLGFMNHFEAHYKDRAQKTSDDQHKYTTITVHNIGIAIPIVDWLSIDFKYSQYNFANSRSKKSISMGIRFLLQ